jgi:hypothetical protein
LAQAKLSSKVLKLSLFSSLCEDGCSLRQAHGASHNLSSQS